MAHETARVSYRDRAFSFAEDHQQRRPAAWTNQGTRRPTEWEDKRARRLAEFAARVPAIMTQLASEVTAAIEEALQAARAVHLEDLDLAPTSGTSETSTSVPISGEDSSISTVERGASASHAFDLVLAVPITRSTECPGSDSGSAGATAAASTTRVISPACVVHEGDDELISAAPSKSNTTIVNLDSTSTPTTPSRPVSGIESVMLTRCSLECPDNDTTVEVPAFARSACSSTLGNAQFAATVLKCADGEEVIAPHLSDVSPKHFPARSFFVSERGTPAITDIIQVTMLFPSSEAAFPAIVRPIAVQTVQFVLCAARPLPWPSFLACHHVRNEILFMPCSLFSYFPGDDYQKLPWPPPRIIFSLRSCSELVSVAEPSSCSQCVHLWLCRSPSRAKVGILFQFTEGPQVDDKFVGYYITDGSGTITRKFAWTLWLVYDFLVRTAHGSQQITGLELSSLISPFLASNFTCHGASPELKMHVVRTIDRIQICNLASSELSYFCDPWMSWQIKLLTPDTKIASSLHALLICMKAQTVCIESDELEMRPKLSLQAIIFTANCYSIVLHCMRTCSSLERPKCPWLLASRIHLSTQLFLGVDNFWFQLSTNGYIEIHHGLLLYTWSLAVLIYFTAILLQLSKDIIHQLSHCFSQLQDLLIAIKKLQHQPVWEAYISGYKLQFSTQFGSSPWWVHQSHLARAVMSSMILVALASDYGRHLLIGGIKTLQLPWDPGACSSIARCQDNPKGLNDACSNSPNAPSQVPWDPGGLLQDRLGGKPDFKKGGLSAVLDALDRGPSTRCMVPHVRQRRRGTNTRRGAAQAVALDGTAGFGLNSTRRCVRLCSSSFSVPLSSS